MATRNVTISAPLGQATFDPDDLPAGVGDNVSWANETNDPHQIAVNGLAVTDVIEPQNPRSPLPRQTQLATPFLTLSPPSLPSAGEREGESEDKRRTVNARPGIVCKLASERGETTSPRANYRRRS